MGCWCLDAARALSLCRPSGSWGSPFAWSASAGMSLLPGVSPVSRFAQYATRAMSRLATLWTFSAAPTLQIPEICPSSAFMHNSVPSTTAAELAEATTVSASADERRNGVDA
jgi:hypothetical protein